MAAASCFTLVCLRQLEEEIALEEGIDALSLSHDRRLLSLRDRHSRCFCYSCDNTRPCFLLPRPVAQNVQFNLWLHLPAEKSVLLDRNLLSEYPGIPCLVALERENAALTFCRFFRIEGPSVNIVDLGVQEAQSPVGGQPIIQWGAQDIAEALPPNTVWRSSVSLASMIGLFPDCRYLLRFGEEDDTTEEAGESAETVDKSGAEVSCQHLMIRLCGAQPDSLVMFINDTVALFLSLTWQGVSVSNCFFLQPPAPGPSYEDSLRFCDITSCQDWVFAITPPPNVYLLIWYIRGVAFHAIPLCDCLPPDVHFVSIEVALDLLGVALCDNHHDIWIVSLDRYFDGAPKGLDWELLKERQRCAGGVGPLDQTSKDYQELSVFPEAFGLQVSDELCVGSSTRRMTSKTSLMDCLVEGVPTYGIPIPGGAFGSGDQFLEFERSENSSSDKVSTDADGGPRSDANVMRCVPYAWHERIHQTQEWLDLDRRWTVHRTSKVDGLPQSMQPGPDMTSMGIVGGGGNTRRGIGTGEAANMLNGFSVPAQHRLGDDDFHYSLYAALQKHAQREFKSRLPPWLTKVTIPRKGQRFNPPMIGVLGEAATDSGNESGSELAEDDIDDDASKMSMSGSPSRRFASRSDGTDGTDGDPDGMYIQDDGRLQGLADHRHKKVSIGRISLAITVSHVFCEIWEALPDNEVSESPWGLCVIPRPTFADRKGITQQTQIDHLTGGLLEMLDDSGQPFTTKQAVTFRSRMRWRSLFTQNHIWYMLSEGRNLHTLMLSQSPVRVISNLLVFENRLKASRLCALNGWNAKQLPVLTLFLGLRFRELDEIRQSLGLLRPDQEMEACQMVMGFIHSGYSCASLQLPFSPSPPGLLSRSAKNSIDGSNDSNDEIKQSAENSRSSELPADRSFVSRLLEIAMQFLTKLIQTRVMQIQECEGACRALTYLQPKHAGSEEPQYASMVNELSQLTVHMQSLRSLQQQLIASFGDEKAYDSGIIIQCPPQQEAPEKLKANVNGPAAADNVVALAQKLTNASIQTGSKPSTDNIEAIVRAALISGKVSSALNWFHELAMAEEGGGTSVGGRVFEEFRVVAGRLAYQLACNQQVDFLFMAMHMLRNVGENVNKFFKAVAFHTSKRVVRRRLLRHLSHMQRLSKDEQALISLVNLLEVLYTNPCYTTEFNRMTTGLVTGQYPQRAHNASMPPFYTWPAGGHAMLLVGLGCDGAVEGHLNLDVSAGEHGFEQQTSLRELPVFQRMPLEMHDIWAGYQTPVMAAMLEMPADARRAWNNLPCGDIEDLDAQPVLGLMNFHKSSNLEHEQESATVADMREEFDGGANDPLLGTSTSQAGAKRCRQCRLDSLKDDIAMENPLVEPTDPFTDALGLGEASPKAHTMGYLHVTLSWMRRWSWDTRARILMEKAHYQPRLVESLPWLQPPPEVENKDQAWRLVWLDFLVAHQDWRGLASWVRSTSLRLSDRADDHGRHSVDLRHLEERGLPYCTSYAKEILLQELGKRGIFCVGDVSSFQALLRRLAQCGRLFDEGYTSTSEDDSASTDAVAPAECALPLDRLLPRRSVCPFHQFFIHFCIDLDLPSVMLLYMQTYELATTIGDLKALQLKHAKKQWASLLLVGRLGNAHLFAASLQHAAILFSSNGHAEKKTEANAVGAWTSGPSHDNGTNAKGMRLDVDSVPFMPLNVLAERSPLSFLATLMFAPVASGLDAATAPQDSPWFVDIALFRKAVEEYPTLCAAFFPAGSEKANAEPAHQTQESGGQLDVSLVESVAEANRDRWLTQGVQQAALRTEGENGGPLQMAVANMGATSGESLSMASPAKEKKQRTLDDMMTFKEDVSLSELLSDVAAFDVKNALKPLPIFGKDLIGSLGAQGELENAGAEADGSLALLVADKEQFHDKLEEGYFLAQGRSMMAFHVLMTRCSQRQKGELRLPLLLPEEDSKHLHRVAKDVALHNLLNEGVVSSTVCFLELCNLETEMLRVDVQAATRIYEHQVRQVRESSAEDTDRPRAAAASVIELFMSFPDTEIMRSRDEMPNRAAETAINSQHLLTALRLLEESTWALDPHPSAPTVSSMQSLAMDSPWHLVALFCRVHCLPRSLTLLHELARNGDWVMFLHESDLQQCPADTVLDVVDGYFTDVPLQSHLKILAYSIAAQERCDSREVHLKGKEHGDGGPESTMEQAEVQQPKSDEKAGLAAQVPQGKLKPVSESRHVVDAIDFLDQCRVRPGRILRQSTGSGLLRHAFANRTARLAVVASCFSDVTLLQCMAVWLSVNTDVNQGHHSSGDAPDAAALDYSPAEVAAQITLLCRRSRAFSLVLRALKIFDPTNPLVDFVKFHRAFMQCRFQSCQEHLRRFVERREAESQPDLRSTEKYCLEMVPYVTSFSEDMVQYLLNDFPRSSLQLLTALDQASFSPHYSQLYRSFRLIQKCELDVDFRMPASELLQLLISRKMFSEAREWAKSSGIVGDTIVFEEVTGMIVEFRQGVWWNVLDERLQLWHKCYDAFLLRNYPVVGAANFFLDITSKLEPDLFAREQLMLLCIAFELLNSATDEGGNPQRRQKETVDSSTKQLQVPSKEQLNRIKLSMLLILTGTNKDMAAELDFSPLDLSYSTLRTLVHRIPESVSALPLYQSELGGTSGSMNWASAPVSAAPSVPALLPEQRGLRSELLPYLDTAISSLINCDEILWAKELAMGFTFESADLKLVEAMEMVASGHHEEALKGLATHGSRFEGLDAHDGGIEHVLHTLRTQCSQRIARFCQRCLVFFSVSTKIGMDYQQVSQVDANHASCLLDHLLSPQPFEADIALCKSLLACYVKAQNKASLASVMANRFIQSMREFGALEWPKGKLDEFVSIIGSSQDMVGDEALKHVPWFQAEGDTEVEGGTAEGGGSRSSTPAMDEHQDELPFECEVEVLIMAYHAYVQACRERSIGELLRFIRKRVEVYVEHQRFALLMRLLVAIPEYHAMEYMFGHLVRHGQLELLLEKGRFQDSAQQPALAVALIRYLQSHFPRNFELLVKVHLCFGLEAQLAELLEHRAILLTQSLGRKWVGICSEEGEEQLLMCLSLFLQCSRFYLRGQRYHKHLIANERASLICLQLKSVQIHLAASLQEQQSAQKALEQQELSASTSEDPLVAFGLGIGVAIAPNATAAESVDADAGNPEAANSTVPPTAEVEQSMTDEPARAADESKNQADELRDDATSINTASNLPEGPEGQQASDESPTPESAAAFGAPSSTPTAHPLAMALTPAPSSFEKQESIPPPEKAAPLPALGPAGDPFVVINLMAAEVEVFAEYHHDFVVCFQVLCVYRHTYGDALFKVWPRALYRQVVLLGNISYLQQFVRHVPLIKEYLEAVVQLYLHEACPEVFPLRAQRMKQFLLDGVLNLETRYQLARQLGSEFADI